MYIDDEDSNQPKKWTEQDALNRAFYARVGSLDPQRISLSYLETLRTIVLTWIDEIEEDILKLEAIDTIATAFSEEEGEQVEAANDLS